MSANGFILLDGGNQDGFSYGVDDEIPEDDELEQTSPTPQEDPIDILSKTPPLRQRYKFSQSHKSGKSSRAPKLPVNTKSTFSSGYLGARHSSAGTRRHQSASNSLLQKQNHERKMRRVKKERVANRSYKHSGALTSEVTDSHPPSLNSAVAPPSPVIQVDTTKIYRCVTLTQNVPPSVKAQRQKKLSSSSMPSCPQDRIQFFKTFSALIRLGTSRKEELDQSIDAHAKNKAHFRWQELLWLELQARNNMISMDNQDILIMEAREESRDVYQDVINFKFFSSRTSQSPQPCCLGKSIHVEPPSEGGLPGGEDELHSGKVELPGGELENFKEEGECRHESLNFGRVDRLESCTSHRSLCLPLNEALVEYTRNTQEAWGKVTGLLNKVERIEQLYPTQKSLLASCCTFNESRFIERVKVLQMWVNLTCELDHKLDLAREALGVEDQDVWWPDLGCSLFDQRGPGEFTYEVEFKRDFQIREDINPELVLKRALKKPSISVSGSDKELVNGEKERMPEEPTSQERNSQNRSFKKQLSVTFSIASDSDDEVEIGDDAGIDDLNQTRDVLDVDEPILSRGGFNGSQSELSLNDEHSTSPPSSPMSSTPSRSGSQGGDSPRVNRLFSDCHFSFDYDSSTSLYRPFVDQNLRHSGLNKMNQRLYHMLGETIRKTRLALQKPLPLPEFSNNNALKRGISEVSSDSAGSYITLPFDPWDPEMEGDEILSSFGALHPEFVKMGLPSYLPVFLFIVRIPVDVMHECLRFRLQHKPTAEPSFHSVQQLLNESKEVLLSASRVKHYYQMMVSTIVKESQGTLEHLDSDIEEYETNLELMLQDYFEYLHRWMQMLQKLPQASVSLKNILEDEWRFAKGACPHIRGGEAQAGKRFCIMACSLFDSINEFLCNTLDQICSALQDSRYLEDPVEIRDKEKDCRSRIKILFTEVRERLAKALGFAKMFVRDLEIAAAYQWTESEERMLEELQRASHIRVVLEAEFPDLWVFVPGDLIHQHELVQSLLDDLCGHEGVVEPHQDLSSNGYILLMKAPEEGERAWKGKTMREKLNVEVTIQLTDIRLEENGMLLVVNHSSSLYVQRKIFERAVGQSVTLVNENTSSHSTIAQALKELKTEALKTCTELISALKKVEQDLLCCKDTLGDRYKNLLDHCFSVAFEYHKEVNRLLSCEEQGQYALYVFKLAKQWMNFVLENSERGHGTRPRWATLGLEFLIVAISPKNAAHLKEEEFLELKQLMNKCICHVIGEQDPNDSDILGEKSLNVSSRSSDFSLSPVPTSASFSRHNSSERSFSSFLSVSSDVGSATPPRGGYKSPKILPGQRSKQIQERLKKLESNRNKMLQDGKRIGTVREDTAPSPIISINCKKVTFRWQRGFKIGDGQYGTTVYSCINMDTGETLAVKEIRFQRNDQSVIKDIADEIRVFEGINHPNLVRYYGVELHREEMLLFMEYCDEGTIAEAAKCGLPEGLIRQYTREVCVAISILHSKNIIHRDIKGANIFLHSDGHVKLGDFGAAIKLKKHHTMKGEINNIMGTAAFMAPEVITQTGKDGYGRAADIWSLGCVVVEMITGKRPWHEYDNDYAIMFKVGEGGTPQVADHLVSEEGQDFLSHCLQQNDKDRSSANKLLNHPFLKVADDLNGAETAQ